MVDVAKFLDDDGECPFDEAFKKIRDQRAKDRILVRIRRLTLGLEGDWKSVGDGVRELRIDEGKGYRVYYGWHGDELVVLLTCGSKKSQESDIEAAKSYWSTWKKQHEERSPLQHD